LLKAVGTFGKDEWIQASWYGVLGIQTQNFGPSRCLIGKQRTQHQNVTTEGSSGYQTIKVLGGCSSNHHQMTERGNLIVDVGMGPVCLVADLQQIENVPISKPFSIPRLRPSSQPSCRPAL
jgi:hypothetical protein